MASPIELILNVDFTVIKAINDRIVIIQTDNNGDEHMVDIPRPMLGAFIRKLRKVTEAEQ